jgi:hypothetical protein
MGQLGGTIKLVAPTTLITHANNIEKAMKRIAKTIFKILLFIILIPTLYVFYQLWDESQENKATELALTRFYNSIEINMDWDTIKDMSIEDQYKNLRQDFFWRDENISIPRPPEFLDEKQFPNDFGEKVAYTVIGLCYLEAGTQSCAKSTDVENRKYIGIVLSNKDINSRHCHSCVVKDAFLFTVDNDKTTITTRKSK